MQAAIPPSAFGKNALDSHMRFCIYVSSRLDIALSIHLKLFLIMVNQDMV